jgi:hypothetical protein
MENLDITTNSGVAGQGISFNIIPISFKKCLVKNNPLIRLRRRPCLRAGTSIEKESQKLHFGVQARALPVDECGFRG